MIVYKTIGEAVRAARRAAVRSGGLWYICNAPFEDGYIVVAQGQEFGLYPLKGVRA